MHLVCVNYTCNPQLNSPDVLIDRYGSLAAWAQALKAAGARVTVVQRFQTDHELEREGVVFRFVHDRTLRMGSVLDAASRINHAIAALHPDVVHVNGLQFARQAARLKRLFRQPPPVLLQDHANAPPRHAVNRWTLRRAMRHMDAISFVSRDQAEPWRDVGFFNPTPPVVELMESSSGFSLQSRQSARAGASLTGDPLCLWVGRLNANKDPVTVLSGFARAAPRLPNARLVMVYGEEDLLPEVRRWLAASDVAGRVTLLGRLPRPELQPIYNSADVLVLGSHHEGSGYAVLEALSCGVLPVVTDIPPFRVLTGNGAFGRLWNVGNADSLARELENLQSAPAPSPAAIRAFFDENFSWDAIGARAIQVYRDLLSRAGR